ncbi:TPA: glycosyltransferase family 4 protein [Vibrio vulnificus]|nr:glycosyltransferase family 4 protein [Vibrio vulnificus]HDY7496203.1 glycosyltransferase family 4 protein [Vibrio vulnificus]HDY8015958.1 glycosyltransferase family 4 protein [Vibrio vulnificus]
MKSIAFLLGDASERGGVERVVFSLASSLSKYHDINILSLYKRNEKVLYSMGGTVAVEFFSDVFEVSMYNRQMSSLKGMFFDINYIRSKKKEMEKRLRGYDFVVCSDIKSVLLCYILDIDIKIITIEHFEYDVPAYVLKILRRILYNKIHKVITLTNEDNDKYNWLHQHIKITIPNILHFKHYPKKKDTNRIIAVGRLTNQKGFDLLIEAWGMIYKKHPSWCLDIIGDGEDKESLMNQIDNNNIKNVSLLPFTDDIHSEYASSEIFVLSSRYEGLGMVLLEAMAHSLACISFDCPAGPKTIIDSGINGVLVPTGDVERLSFEISNMIDDTEFRKRVSKNAPEIIKEFSEETICSKWSSIINEEI